MNRFNQITGAGVYGRQSHGGSWPKPPVPQPEDLERALSIVHQTEQMTPLMTSRSLSNRLGRDVHLKFEPASPVRSFKHRGALVAIRRIARETEARIVVTASTGNHGQGIAYAASRSGMSAIVFSPEGATEEKLEAIRRLGAEVRIEGAHLGEAQEAAARVAGKDAVYIEDGDNADLMAGAASVVSELLEADDRFDAVIVPIGGGNLIAGSLLARELHRGGPEVVGVQSAAACGATQSWIQGEIVERECSTFAGGLATTRPGELALSVMTEFLESVVLVDEADLYRAIGLAVVESEMELEGAAAAPIAALERFGDSIPGERIALVITGNWSSGYEIDQAVDAYTKGLS